MNQVVPHDYEERHSTTMPTSQKEIQILRTSGSERTVSERIADFARSVGFEGDRIDEIKTAVGEAVLNAIEHASPEAITDVAIVRFWLEEDALKVSVSSKGPRFHLSDAKPDIRAKVEGRDRPRGWGAYLMKNLADDVDVRFENKFSIVTMTFRARNADRGTDNV
jgi:serine/threonine-protein kinase RsbW